MVNLYRWLLFLYPAAYRHEFAREMTLVFCQVKRPQEPRASPGESHFAFASCQVWSLARCASRFAPVLAPTTAFHSGGSICVQSFAFRVPQFF